MRTYMAQFGLTDDDFDFYGKFTGKIRLDWLERQQDRPDGRLILVTAMTPTSRGEGKTLTSGGIGQAIGKLGRRGMIALREPSLGPVFGMKGGATGGGYAQVIPMEDINLHFNGDIHAITTAHNLLAAMLDKLPESVAYDPKDSSSGDTGTYLGTGGKCERKASEERESSSHGVAS